MVGADQLPRPALAFLGDALADEPPTRSGTAADDPEARRLVHGVDPVVRQQMCKRRRDTLMVLVSVFVCSAIVGVIPGAQLSLIVTLVSGLARPKTTDGGGTGPSMTTSIWYRRHG